MGLRRLMLSNNVKNGLIYKYDIMFVQGYWYAWYQADAKTFIKGMGEANGENL